MKEFRKDNVGDYKMWPKYKKVFEPHMLKIDGPFFVETREGRLYCEEGFVAIDSKGNPYPIATDEQEVIYELTSTSSAI